MTDYRICKRCVEEKRLREFYPKPGHRLGRDTVCMDCRRLEAMHRYYRKKDAKARDAKDLCRETH